MNLMDSDVFDPCLLDADQTDRTPDTSIRQMRTPIPSEHAMSFPEKREACHCIGRTFLRRFFIRFLNIFCRRSNFYTYCILPMSDGCGSIIFPDTMHILCTSYELIIQKHLGNRIQPFCTQQDLIRVKQIFRYIECPFINEIMIHPWKRFQFICPYKGIFDDACMKQIMIYRSGNTCGYSFHLTFRYGKTPAAFKASAQINS